MKKKKAQFNVNQNDGKYRRVHIGKCVDELFNEENRNIEIEIEGKIYYSRLPDSFFNKCRHLHTAYDNPRCSGQNRLQEWIRENNVERVKLEVIKECVKYKLTKIKTEEEKEEEIENSSFLENDGKSLKPIEEIIEPVVVNPSKNIENECSKTEA